MQRVLLAARWPVLVCWARVPNLVEGLVGRADNPE